MSREASPSRPARTAAAALVLLASAAVVGGQELSINDVMLLEGDAGMVDAVFTVMLQSAVGMPVTVDFLTQDGTATESDADYIGTGGTLVFPGVADPEFQLVTVQVVGDPFFEMDEFFFVNLSNAMGAQIVDNQGVGNILNDDVLTLSIGDASVTEGDTGTIDATFAVTVSGQPIFQDVTVDFSTRDGTATVADNDYEATSGSLLFPAPMLRRGSRGPITQFVTVTVNGDTQVEPDELFFVDLMNAVGAPVIDGVGDGSILNDDFPTLVIDDVTVTEGDAGTTDAVFTVTLSDSPPATVTVDFATRDGTATVADGDYGASAGALLFAAGGPVTQSVTVAVNGDTAVEPDETYFVDLTNAAGATIADGEGAGGITNDDSAMLSINDFVLDEGDAGTTDAVFTVTLSQPRLADVTVDFGTRDGTATVADGDYVASFGSLLFVAGGPLTQNVTVAVNGDTVVEPDENFFVDLTNAAGATIADGEGAGSITNDDVLTISIGDVGVFEGDSGTTAAVFTITLSNTSVNTVTVDTATRDGSATVADGDYIPASGQVAFGPGTSMGTFTVQVHGDTVVEPDETFFVDLSNPSEGSIADGEGMGTITNDDEEEEGDDEEEEDPVSEIRLVDTPAVGEADGTARITVQRTGSAGVARVTVSVLSSSATAGDDFVALSEVASWAAGEAGARTVEVEIIDDNIEEGEEVARIELTSVFGADLVGAGGADLAILDDDVPMAIEGVSETETLSIVNGAVGLEVLVQREDGSPVQGATVLWSVEGDAELVDGEATQSDAEGVAVNEAQLGGTPGTVVVTAALEGVEGTTTFEITVQGDLVELVDAAASPGEASIASVLDASCIQAEGSFADACDYLFGLEDPADQQQVLRELTPREVAAQGALTLDSMRVQLSNVEKRLSGLRGGAESEALDQLSFRSGRDGFTIAQLKPDARSRADAAFLRKLEGAWWDATIAEEIGAGGVIEEETSRWGLFVNGSISMGERSDTDREEGFDLETGGVTAGLDYRRNDRTVLGGAIGVLDTDVSLVRNGGGLDAQGLSASAYWLYFREAFYLTTIVSFGQLDFDLERAIDLPEPFEGSDRLLARATTDADQLSLALEGGYDRALGAATVGGFARLSFVDAEIGDYSENGAGPFALAILGQDIESLLAEAGINWSYAASRSWGVAQPALHLAYLHEFEDSSRLLRGRFVEDLEANEFVLPTDSPDRSYVNLGAGITFTLTGGRSFFLFYDTDLERDDLELYTLSFGLRWEL